MIASDQIIDPDKCVNPICIIQNLIIANNWTYERDNEEEIRFAYSGTYCNYQFQFYWNPESKNIGMVCIIDLKIPELNKKIFECLGLLNNQMTIGHFESFIEEGDTLLRLRHINKMGCSHMDDGEDVYADLIESILVQCDYAVTIIQPIIWSNADPVKILEFSGMEASGNA